MNFMVETILKHMELENEKWSEMERLKMKLGFQVFFHNILMISCILLIAKTLGIYMDSVILLTGYGLLKLNAGGIHFEKSWACLLSTCAFVIGGVIISRHLKICFYCVLFIYILCMAILWIVGPQGTKNNPISYKYYNKLRRKTIVISGLYFIITIYRFLIEKKMTYLLLVAIVFETISMLPNIKKRVLPSKQHLFVTSLFSALKF